MNANGGKPHILLVDDEEHLLITVQDFLAHHGYAVTVARRAEDALQRLRSLTPDLVILDISMPGLGGIGFLRAVIPDGMKPPWPILVLTARANMQGFFQDIPIDGFVTKPCRKEDLLERIREILMRTRRPAQQGAPGNRVLLGEDDPHAARSLVPALEDAGLQVTVCDTGPAVIEEALRMQPAAIVIRRVLTRMNGESVAALLSAMEKTRDIPVVLFDDRDDMLNHERLLRHAVAFVTLTRPDKVARATADAVRRRAAQRAGSG
jgi:DNA-binding response OmpR family regulator